jgi:hypothetical protein
LEWNVVKVRIEQALAPLTDVEINVYEPKGAPASDKMVRNREVPKMTAGRAALVELIRNRSRI